MNFYINNEKADITLENEKTLGEVFDSFKNFLNKNKMVMTGVSVDGKYINIRKLTDETKKSLAGIHEIRFEVLSIKLIFIELKNAVEMLDTFEKSFESIPSLLQSGKKKEALALVVKFSNIVQYFLDSYAKASFVDDLSTININGEPVNEFFISFNEILSDFAGAMESEDVVGVQDLAEYEIAPRLRSVVKAMREKYEF